MVGDCKSAFYRIRSARPVWVNAGGRDFLCHRMVNGLSMGPVGLGSSLGETWNHCFSQVAQGPAFAGLFVDDFFLTKAEDADSLLCHTRTLRFRGFSRKIPVLQTNDEASWGHHRAIE